MFAELEKRVAFAAVEFFQIENIFVKRDRLLDVVHFDHDMITTVNLHAHFTIYLIAETARFLFSCAVRSTWTSLVISRFFFQSFSAWPGHRSYKDFGDYCCPGSAFVSTGRSSAGL